MLLQDTMTYTRLLKLKVRVFFEYFATNDDLFAGKFLPTRRTPGISTSALLSRIVSQYRSGDFNSKLEQNGNEELSWKDEDAPMEG